MALTLGGLASGIDTQGLIDKLMEVAQTPLTQVNTRKTQVDSASQVISSLSTKLSTLKTAALALSTPGGFSSFSATSSDPALVASASGGANAGSYSVEVLALARAQKSRSTAMPSSSTALGTAGTLSITVGTKTPVDVSIETTDTLEDVARKITASGARVTASVMRTAEGSRIVVQGLDAGAENAFSITESSTTLGLATPASTYETAQDASLKVDGMAVSSATNQVTGVIPGVKLALVKTTTAAATLQVSADATSLRSKITTLVSAYNDFVNTGHAAAGYGNTKAQNPVLAADTAIRSALHGLGAIMSSVVPGATGAFRSLGSVGISLKREGTLTFDSAVLDSALAADPAAVARLFVTDTTTGATGHMKTIMDAVDGLVKSSSSPIAARQSALGSQSKRLAERAIKIQEQLDTYEQQLKKKFAVMDDRVGRYQQMANYLSGIGSGGSQ